MRKNRIERICENCGKTFWVQPYRLKVPGNPARFCSMTCRTDKGGWAPYKGMGKLSDNIQQIITSYQGGESIENIANHFDVTFQAIYYHLKKANIKFRGTSREDILRAVEISRIRNRNRKGSEIHNFKELPVNDIVAKYQNGVSMMAIAKEYGVSSTLIMHRLRDNGIKSRRRGFSRRRRCPDGHIVDSHWEYSVDQWLYEHIIEHEVHPIVPWWNNGKSPQRSDFRVGNIFIEVWGIEGNTRYDKKRIEKIIKFKDLGIRLIQIFPHHILDGDYSPLETLL